jgi:hypothetical protein
MLDIDERSPWMRPRRPRGALYEKLCSFIQFLALVLLLLFMIYSILTKGG